MPPVISELLAVSRGQAPADLVLTNARIVNVFTGKIESGDVAVYGGYIAGIGRYTQTKQLIDLEGRFLAPAFIDGHTHLESSMLDIGEYARAVVPRGTGAIVTDLHEIANVCGLTGIDYVLKGAEALPLEVFLMAPSCVPSSNLETSGAVIGIEEIRRLLRRRNCLGLGEVMNYPGVIQGDPAVLAKIALAKGKIIDGHAPGLSGKELNAYIAAGIQSDHESVTLEEAIPKLACGLRIMIREGSSEKNLEALLPAVNETTFRRCLLVVDDRSCSDLLRDGDIDAVVCKAVKLGLDPVRAIQMATINAAEYFRIPDMGAIAPGYQADMIVINDITEMGIDRVFHRGNLVAEAGKPLFAPPRRRQKKLLRTVRLRKFGIDSLRLTARRETFPVIEVVPGQIITRRRDEKVEAPGGFIEADVERDLLKLVVVERHQATGNIGKGLVRGFGLKRGALASTVSHDAHNLIAVGTSDEDILAAVREIQKMQGGLVAVDSGKPVASLPLPVAGLLSTEPAEKVTSALEKLDKAAAKLGSTLMAPFSTLSFLALPVIPELRLTDRGLVDVNSFSFVE